MVSLGGGCMERSVKVLISKGHKAFGDSFGMYCGFQKGKR